MHKRGPKTPTTDRQPTGEPPEPPPWLRADAVEVFRATCAQLLRGGGVALVDADILAAYALAVCDLREADAGLAGAERYYTGPNGAVCIHPGVRDRRQAMDSIARLAAALGIGATARKRNNAAAPASSKRADPLAEFQE